MIRRPKRATHDNHERWLVSYADFITLMFAFFVVMFAASQSDKNTARQVSDSVREALERGQFGGVVAGLLGRTLNAKAQKSGQPPPPPVTGPGDLASSLAYLNAQLQPEIEAGKVQIALEARGLVISLREAAYFPSGDDAIVPGAGESLEKIAGVIAKLPNAVRLEGHTDSVPIHNARFHSNWDLSAARSIALLEMFSERFRIPATRLSVAGYADTMPVESNESEQGRAHNRRVDVVIVNPEGLRIETRPVGP